MYGRTPILPEQLFDLVYIWGINIKVFLVGEGSSAAKTRMLEKHSVGIYLFKAVSLLTNQALSLELSQWVF